MITDAEGLSVVVALVGFSIETSLQNMLTKPLKIFWWAVASLCGGCGLAILYKGKRNMLQIGTIALIGNVGLTAFLTVDGSRKLEWLLRSRQSS